MKQNVLIFDSSALISIAMNGLLNELEKLKQIFPGKFIIPQEVKFEIVNHPLETKRFELEALRLNQLLKKGILEMPESIEISSAEISTESERLLKIANSTFFEGKKREIHLIDYGESACLALSKILEKKGVKNLILIDERTTRLISEKPENLKKLLVKKIHTEITLNKENLKYFSGIKIARSAELMFLAYKKGIIEIKDKKTLDAILYALKYKGCAISSEEIETLEKMA